VPVSRAIRRQLKGKTILTSFDGKTVVITGGATGIGRGLALAFADQGMNVVLASTSEERLAKAVDLVRSRGGSAISIVCDVADRAAVRDLADQAVAKFGAVHVICANAAITTGGPFLNHRDEDWDWVYDVVLRGVTNCVQAFYPLLAAQREGHILLTGSQAGLVPDWVLGHGPYTSAKAGVTALAVALRPEAIDHNVGVSLLIPAGTETDISLSARSRQERYGKSADGEMRPRPGAPEPIEGSKFWLTPDEVAAQVVAELPGNPAFIVTHPGLKPIVADYFGRILAAYSE
jgi:NAD(P)-dependent dehydrogenase (short-subunit alcohol dehydrogenase family)